MKAALLFIESRPVWLITICLSLVVLLVAVVGIVVPAEIKINFLDGTVLDHDAGRIVLFFVLAAWFAVRVRRQPGDRISLRWSLFFFFLFAWTVMDHCPPLRRWLHLI